MNHARPLLFVLALTWVACAAGAASHPEDEGGAAGAGGDEGAGGAAGSTAGGAGMATAGQTSAGQSGATAGTGTSGSATAGSGTAGTGTSGSATAGTGTSGSGTAGSGTAGTGTSGSGTAGSGTAGTGTSGSGTAGASCTCGAVPTPVCLADGVTRRSFTGPGMCAGGSTTCTFMHSDETCPFGCAGGACTMDPCSVVSCNTPPTPVCSGASVRTYSGPGTCGGNGACTYPFTDGAPCPFGCTNGACNADPCAGVTCTNPPAPSCFDANTLRTPSGPGTCQSSTGMCQFPTTDQSCPGGCAAGVCKQCSTGAQCSMNQYCASGTCTACGPAACGNGVCDCGETAASCAGDCAPCPTAVVIGGWASADDGWTYDGLWKRSGGAMVAGSTSSYCNNYTQNLTYGTDVDLSTCTAPTLTFQVKLADDPSWTPRADKSERLYVQCSGDAGANWTNLTPVSWPANQSACATSYCNGGTNDRSFPLTAQTIPIPAACLTKNARFRFQAKGACAWRMQNPGWTVDGVTVN